ncbi:hypothetical protein D0Z00_000457 [Geotrichum galactomycetum]|uniref:Uncharacterized protein n=1 Tax=Geotrichum galactomycetum TaxID=27317 RepID=A0ACB6V9Q2_9ASCO|nr:hypothetical protein D0Z00_000457 [Geotrichum candidum]
MIPWGRGSNSGIKGKKGAGGSTAGGQGAGPIAAATAAAAAQGNFILEFGRSEQRAGGRRRVAINVADQAFVHV